MIRKQNPYNYNLPVTPDMFYGRVLETQKLAEQLTTLPGDSIALIGGRRIGKTSLLEALRRRLEQAQIEGDKDVLPIPIFLDLSGEGINTHHAFFLRVADEAQFCLETLLDGMAFALDPAIRSDAPPAPVFRRLLQQWSRKVMEQVGIRPRLVLLLDECEQIVDVSWASDLYGALRSLLVHTSTRSALKVVMAGSHRFLTQVRQNGSPLRNVLQYHRLQALSKDAAWALINEPTERLLSEEIVEMILAESGGHPFLTQFIMHSLWEMGLTQASIGTVREIASEFPRVRGDFDAWLQGMGASSITAYKALLSAPSGLSEEQIRKKLTVLPPDLSQALDALGYHGLITRGEANTYQATTGMFKRWFTTFYSLEKPAKPSIASERTKQHKEERRSLFAHGYALLIGVGADLPVTIEDASELYTILTDPHRCAYSEAQVKLLTGTAADRKGILNGLDWLMEQVKVDSQATAIVYFSGHGGHDISGQYHLVPYNFNQQDLAGTAVTGSEFTARLQAVKAQKVLVLLDCCHAGGMAEAKVPGFRKSPVPPEFDAILTAGSGRAVIASSRKDEFSYTGTPYSVFTQALREGLAGYGAAEQDGYAYMTDIALHVGRVVPNRTQDRQHPILKLAAADNFAVAYYAGGSKSPHKLPNAYTSPLPIEQVDTELLAGYQGILKKYRLNLLHVEERMAEFYDQAAVPLDLERNRNALLARIEETEAKIQSEAHKAGWVKPAILEIPPTLEDVMSRLDRMETTLGSKLEVIKDGLRVIYRRIPPSDQVTIEAILSEMRFQRLEQETMARTIGAVRRVLQHIQTTGVPIADETVKQTLSDIYKEVVSGLDFQQQFELSLPVIPFLLDYKISLGGSIDLGAVWNELKDRLDLNRE